MLLALAPMQDVTDLAFMRTLLRIGSLPDYFVTAYFRSTATNCAYMETNLGCIVENETGKPIWAQIAGSDPAAITRDIETLLKYPIAGIDLNAGCPSPLVNRNNAGAGLLRDFPRFDAILKAMRAAVPEGQLSVKCRLGWIDAAAEFEHILDLIRSHNPDRVAVHARTRKQLYGGTPLIDYVRDAVRELSSCPVMGNGDIVTVEDAQHWMSYTGCAGLMIGRGAVRNPFIFRQLHGGAAPTQDEMRNYYLILIEETGKVLYAKRTEKGHCNRMKKYLSFIFPDLDAQREYDLRRCDSIAQMQRLLTM